MNPCVGKAWCFMSPWTGGINQLTFTDRNPTSHSLVRSWNPKMVAKGRQRVELWMSNLYRDIQSMQSMSKNVFRFMVFCDWSYANLTTVGLNSRWFSHLPKNCWNVIFCPTLPLQPATQTNQKNMWPFRNVLVIILIYKYKHMHTCAYIYSERFDSISWAESQKYTQLCFIC